FDHRHIFFRNRMMKENSRDYGLFLGEMVKEFTITNSSGMSFKAISYGATLTDVTASDKEGNISSVLLGMESLDGYMRQTYYLGASIGPFGNRIANACFTLEGKTVKLTQNNGSNNLHSGPYGFDRILWKGEPFHGGDSAGVRFSRDMTDGEDSFPGNRKFTITMTLNEDNELEFHYQGISDKTTPMNLTNHGYWNLSGTLNSTEDHTLKLNASHYLPVDDLQIPIGAEVPVAGGAMDFTREKPIGQDLEAAPVGFDHNFCVDGVGFRQAAVAVHPESGRVMEVWTDLPGVQFYAAKPMETFEVRGGTSGRCAGFCLETQYYPDCVNQSQFASCIIPYGKTFETKTVYKFSVKG
ncbi:MAG: galactose mutarotase, partial [Spirochaetaceae bacterium]|nr:galactose mutarotase [Spirochaetaceae bacterium]